ncbi:MAG: FAD-binding oxidoreductase [Burkholderiales bacterium]
MITRETPVSVVTLANGRSFVAERGMSILDAASAAGLVLEHSCRTGRCGSCKAKVLSGSTAALRDEASLTVEELADRWILTCTREAEGDLALDIEDLSALAGISAKTLPCRIKAITRVASDVVTVELRLPPNAGFAFLAGQYIDVTGPGGIKRSYSVASDMRSADKLELHVRQVDGGAMSDYWFAAAKVNDLLRFRGPLGTFFLRELAGLDLIFLATGTGYAPVHAMLRRLDALEPSARPASTHLLWGGRVPRDIYAEPSDCATDVQFTPVLSRADATWAGARGHVQDVLLAQKPNLANAVVYACGSDAMIHAARTALIAAGLHPKRFRSDAFVSSD